MAEDAQGPAFCGDEQMAQALSAVVRAASHRAEGFKIWRILNPEKPTITCPFKDLNYFGAVCYLGYRDIALLMVKSGSVDINGKDEYGCTPTYHASWKGMIEVLQALVGAGADPNQAMENGYTPLHEASEEGHLDVVRCLVEAGAGINQDAEDGDTPLSIARDQDHKQIVAFLKRTGAVT